MASLLDDHFAPWTADDLDRFPEGWQVEIMEGTLVVDHNPETRGPWTSADLDLFPESNRFEVIDGRLYVNAQPNLLHQMVADRLRSLLETQLSDDLLVVREIGVTMTRSHLGPDISLVRRADAAWHAKQQPASAAVLVVEVASPTTRRKDRVLKFDKYAEAGIPGYWRVDLDPVAVVAYALRDGGYVELGAWREGETVTVDEPVSVRFDPADLLP